MIRLKIAQEQLFPIHLLTLELGEVNYEIL